jgi:CYTH domain-containing protein
MNPKYTAEEIERRWLVDLLEIDSLADLPVRRIEDRYLHGTALRLRKVVEPSGAATYKLGKKYGKSTRLSEPVVSIYLGEDEHDVLSRLPGTVASKERYALLGGSLDVYRSPRPGFAVFEVEFATEDEARVYAPPGFTREEITGNERYSGFALSDGQIRRPAEAPLHVDEPSPAPEDERWI